MTPLEAALIVALIAVVGNRIVAVFAGLWFHLPPFFLMSLLIFLDVVQIPFYYWVYERGVYVIQWIPAAVRQWLQRDVTTTGLGRWTASLGGLGVMMVAAVPAFGGGIWTATLLAYSIKLKKSSGYGWMITGTVVSYLLIYAVCDTVVSAIRYFSGS